VLFIVGVCSIPLVSFSTVLGRVLVYRSVTFVFEIQGIEYISFFLRVTSAEGFMA